tara:strand:+ start:2543 stop:2713 length:171 start_codon:yes stop_codon:yes gene_type:complete
MTNTNVKRKWRVTGIEYSGIGDKPYFILNNGDGEVKLMAVERGITNLRSLLSLEEE